MLPFGSNSITMKHLVARIWAILRLLNNVKHTNLSPIYKLRLETSDFFFLTHASPLILSQMYLSFSFILCTLFYVLRNV